MAATGYWYRTGLKQSPGYWGRQLSSQHLAPREAKP